MDLILRLGQGFDMYTCRTVAGGNITITQFV